MNTEAASNRRTIPVWPSRVGLMELDFDDVASAATPLTFAAPAGPVGASASSRQLDLWRRFVRLFSRN